MKANNPILLIVLQSQGIEYNELLNRLTASYSSINSARAALSRALKDLSVLGLIVRKENKVFATDKAQVLVQSEMKNKLIAKLNELINSRNNVKEIDSIVQQMQVLIERSKNDSALLKVARSSTSFSLNNLRETNSKLEKEINHLNYLKGIFELQINSLQEMDFDDLIEFEFGLEAVKKIESVLKESQLNEVSVEFSSNELKEKILGQEKAKSFKSGIPLDEAIELMKKIIELNEKDKTVFFASPIKIEFMNKKIILKGPYSKIGKK
ncbi:MAG: hypothetical protein ABIA76_03795 [Candidatus Diapherotrites archaeon]